MYNPENLKILKILVQTIVRCNLTYSFSATYTLSRDREVARTEECPNKKFACGKTKQSPYLFLFVVAQFIAPRTHFPVCSRANHAPRTHFPVCSRAIHAPLAHLQA